MRTPPVAAAPSAPPGRSRHETAPADPLGFPALLTKTEARTAVAEGHTKTDEHPGRGHAHAYGHARRDEAHAARDERAAARDERRAACRDGATAPTAPVADAPQTGGDTTTTVTPPVTPAAGETPAPTSTNVTGATAPEPAPVPDPAAAGAVGGTAPESADGSGTVAGGVPAMVTGAPVTSGADADGLPGATPQDVSTTTSAPATVPTPIPGTTTDATDAVTVDPEAQILPPTVTTDGSDPSATPGTTDATAGGAQADGDAPEQHAGQGRPGGAPVLPDAASDRARAAVAAAHDGVPTRAHGAPGHRDTVAAPAPAIAPVPTAAAPVAQPVPAAVPATAAALPAAWASRGMAQTVERLIDLVHVATARGVARAKLQLHPQELGGIEVRLRQSADGLVASITAQRADGLEAVTQAGAELRRSLEDRGLTLARLDISLAADGRGGRGWHGPQDRSGFPGRGTGRAARDSVEEIAGETVAVESPTVTTIPGAGVLVDVQA